MTSDHVGEMKARMRIDLKEAMTGKRPQETSVLRALLAAIDNAEAPAIGAEVTRTFGSANEVERLALTADELQAILLGEMHDRERAATEFAGLGQAERAEMLLAEAAIARRYVESA